MKKKIVTLFAVLALALASSNAMAYQRSLWDGRHNLSAGGSDNGITSNTAEVCVFCHTPHNAQTAKPLWNRLGSNNAANYILYSSSSMKNTPFKSGLSSDSPSLLCISCHDGTVIGGNVAVQPKDLAGVPLVVEGTFGDTSRVANDALAATSKNFGTNLGKHHPINFNVALSGQSYKLGTVDATNHTISTGYSMHPVPPLPLFVTSRGTATLECTSCHDAHDQGDGINQRDFLRATMNASALCMGCHYL